MSGSSPTPGLFDNLVGASDIMLGRSGGLKRMDLSTEGFGWSFAGIVLAGLIDMSVLSFLYDNSPGASAAEGPGKAFYLTGKLAAALLAYIASLLALYLLCRTPDEQLRFSTAVITHNWAAPIVSLLFLPLILASILFGWNIAEGGSQAGGFLTVFWIGCLILFGIRLMRISLDVTQGRAALYFFITTAVSLMCSQGFERLIGLGPI